MMKTNIWSKKVLSTVLILAMVLSLAPMTGLSEPSYAANNYTVTSTADTNTDGTLRNALEQVQAGSGGDTISVSPSLSGQTITLTSELPDMSKSFTLNGNGIIISGDNKYGILKFSTGTIIDVTLNRVNFVEGNRTSWPYNGGAIYIYGVDLHVNDCTFKNNTVSSTNIGGAIYSRNEGKNTSTKLINCLFAGNMSNKGGVIFYSSGTEDDFTAINCTFAADNTANEGNILYYEKNAGTTPYPQFLNCIIAKALNGDIFSSYNINTNDYIFKNTLTNSPSLSDNPSNFGNIVTSASLGLNADYTLAENSPAINTGNNSLYPLNENSMDLAGNVRIVNDTIDMGAYEYGSTPTFKAVTGISGVPATAEVGTNLNLTGNISPNDAMNKKIIWSIKNAGPTGATVSNDIFYAVASGTATITATVKHGLAVSSDYTQDFNITVNPSTSFIPVTNIIGVPTTANVGTNLSLTGTVAPYNATNKTITWSIKNAGSTGATVTGNTFNATATGTAIVTATIVNGASAFTNYTKDFNIIVNPSQAPFIPVTSITNVDTTLKVGSTLILSGSVTPSNATNKTIKWSIKNAGATGATVNGDVFSAKSAGTATVTATILNGKSASANYVKDFIINVIPRNAITVVPGNSGKIFALSVGETSLTLKWTKARETIEDSELEYFVFQSRSGNISTVNECWGNSRALLKYNNNTDIDTYQVTGLSPNTTYYFNVLASEDETNMAVYKMISVRTKGKADLSKVKITIKDMAWTGKRRKPTSFIYEGRSYAISTNATVISYGKNKNIGKGTIRISGKGANFKGTKTITFKIVPKKNSISKITTGKKKMTVKWKKVSKVQKITKYQMRYRIKGTIKWKTKTYSASKSSATIKSLKKGKKYEVQVRSYKTVSKVKYYSAWSSKKTSKKIK